MIRPRVITVGISGPSCSGKTTLALLLKKLLNRVIVINQDEYFKSDHQIPLDENTGLANWDSPAAVDFKSLNEAINRAREDPFALLKQKPKSLQNNHHGSDLLSLADFTHLYQELDVLRDVIFIIVEGFLLFCDEDVCQNLDTKFFITASREVLKARRESRTGYVTLQGYWVDPPGYFDQIVWPQFVLWNDHLIDDNRRDPLIHVIITDNTTALNMTSSVIHKIKCKAVF